MLHKSEKIKKALEAKGYVDVKVWYEKPTVALEKSGNGGGWIFSWAERDKYWLGYNFDSALQAINKMQKVEPDESFQDHLCVCGHKRYSHSEIGCEVFINEFMGDCPCLYFCPEFRE